MRQSLITVRERILVALRAACAQSAATSELLERLEAVDREIVGELCAEINESRAWAADSRARLRRAVDDTRRLLNGGIWEVVFNKSGKPACQDDTCCWNKDGFCAAAMEKKEGQCDKQEE